MRTITAALPALGTYNIPFYKESYLLLKEFGEKELNRLDRIAHLGVAARVFAGSNHSRYEYVLLQCAVVNLLPKYHLNDEHFSISTEVNINGLSKTISSGEELLKCWFLLSNFGHTHSTYGVERTLLEKAHKDKAFKRLLLHSSIRGDLRKWCNNVIDNFDDANFHYIISLHRIANMPKGSKLKGLFIHVLRSLLIPLEDLDFADSAQKYKLFKLRTIFSQVRLLCIVTLDAYYSHHPIRYQLTGALMNLANLLDDQEKGTGFFQLLYHTAGWLADEIYLHPDALAALRQYEITSMKKLDGRQAKDYNTPETFYASLNSLMYDGFGNPKIGYLVPLFRLSYSYQETDDFANENTLKLRDDLEKNLTNSRTIRLSVIQNPYTDKIHIDFFYRESQVTSADIGRTVGKVYVWIARRLEFIALQQIKRFPKDFIENANVDIDQVRKYYLNREITTSGNVIKSLFYGIIRFLIPNDHKIVISEFIPNENHTESIRLIFKYLKGGEYDNLKLYLSEKLDAKSHKLSPERAQEIKALQTLVKRTKAKFALCCSEKILIKDIKNRTIDEWDGLLIEVYEDKMKVKIVEAKNLSSKIKNTNQAYKQLKATRDLVRTKHIISSRRTRIRSLGAYLTFTF